LVRFLDRGNVYTVGLLVAQAIGEAMQLGTWLV